MQQVTIDMVAKHTGKHPKTVRRVFRQHLATKLAKKPGVKGYLIPLSDVNKFLRESWPSAGEMRINEN